MVAGGVATPPPAPTPPAPTPPAPTPPAPTPSPNPPGTITTFSLYPDTTASDAPFSFVLGLKEGDLLPGEELQFSGADVQYTPKNYWPDGSLKLAVVAGTSDVTADQYKTVSVIRGAKTTGTAINLAALKATGVQATMDCGTFGSVSWANSDWDTPVRTWVSGHRMSSWIYRKAVGSDAHLVAWLEVKCFAGGKVEILPWVENGYLKVAGPTNKNATFTFTVNGVVKFPATALDIPHHCRTPLIKGTMVSHWHGTSFLVVPKQERNYLQNTNLVQTYSSELNLNEWTGGPDEQLITSFEPFQRGSFANGMGEGGEHAGLGVQPGWEANYIVSGGRNAYKQMLWMGYSWGRYGIHYRDETTQKPIRFSQHERTGLYHSAITNAPADTYSFIEYLPENTGSFPQGYEHAHTPRAPLMAYMATGWYYFMEQAQFQATVNFLGLAMSRDGTKGIILYMVLQSRALAWTIRSLFDAACFTPEDDPLYAEFNTAVDHNAAFYYDRIQGSFGMLPNNYNSEDMSRHQIGLQCFQVDFIVAAFGHGVSLRVGSNSTSRQKLKDFFFWNAQSTVGRLGPLNDATASPFSRATYQPYVLPGQYAQYPDGWQEGDGVQVISPAQAGYEYNVDFEGKTGPYMANWGQIHANFFKNGYQNPLTTIVGGYWGYTPLSGWGSLFMALGPALRHGVPGAAEGWLRIQTATNKNGFIDSCVGRNSAKYAIVGGAYDWNTDAQAPAPGPTPTPPPPPPAPIPSPPPPPPVPPEEYLTYIPPAGQRANINLNSLNGNPAVDPETPPYNKWWNGYYGSSIFGSASGAWNWAIQAPEYGVKGAIIFAGGGHGSSTAQVAAIFDINTRMWSSVGAAQNLPIDANWTGFQFDGTNLTNYNGANDQRSRVYLDYPYTTQYGTSYIMLNAHMYLHMEYAPPSATNGTKGSIIMGHAQWSNDPSSPLPGDYPQYPSLRHHMDLDTGLISRGSTTPPHGQAAAENNAFVRDTKRNRLWEFHQQQSIAYYEDLDEPKPRARKQVTIGTVPGGPPEIGVQYFMFCYIEVMDAILVSGGHRDSSIPMGFYWIDMSTGFPVLADEAYKPPARLMPCAGYMAGMAYSPVLNAVYFYEGRKQETCEVLQFNTTNFKTTTHSWRREAFTGPTPPGVARSDLGDQSDAQYYDVLHSAGRKWMYVEAGDYFLWTHGVSAAATVIDGTSQTGIVQAWKPPGTVVAS